MCNAGDGKSYFYDGLQVLAEGTGQNDKMHYTLAPSTIGGIICRDNNGAKYWHHFARLGNVVGVIDENADMVRICSNDAFGVMFHAYEGDGYDNIVSDVPWYSHNPSFTLVTARARLDKERLQTDFRGSDVRGE